MSSLVHRLPSLLRRARVRGSRGGTAVEFAIIVSIALSLVIMTVDVGRYLADLHAIDYGVSVAARYAAVHSSSASTSTIKSKFTTAASGLLGNCSTCTVNVTFSPSYTVGSTVTVAASFPWKSVSVLTMLGAKTISSSATMTVVH